MRSCSSKHLFLSQQLPIMRCTAFVNPHVLPIFGQEPFATSFQSRSNSLPDQQLFLSKPFLGKSATSAVHVSHSFRTARNSNVLMVRKINSEELETVLANGAKGPLIIDFYATWCGPCVMLSKELEKYEKTYSDDGVQILKVDTDEEAEIASALQIRGLPTIFFIKDGTLLYRMEGALPANAIKSVCDQLFFGKEMEEINIDEQ